ncbi:hypothetical protein CRI94_02600 [Longibacter salinarum]|uniref:Uncharacterized protein n=1 Tax=Longibacter salinarum TaxID=1850348 RepID=A0A2A8D2S6_9BACT|nr:hypothetical protein [Longibacter salinarum]PEN15190.1 hypothetical protein CRI94_02600 [Longibacter salinarum]
MSVGMGMRYHHVHVEEYESAHAVAVQAGLVVPLLATLTMGATARNLTGADIAGGPLPRSLAVGVHYRPTSSVNVYSDVYKDVAFPWSLRGGIEVWPVSMFAVRVGAARHPSRFSVGVGLETGPVSVDMSAERHPELGWSPAAGLSARW